MIIDFACPGCGKTYKADDSFAGRKMRCKQCGGVVPIPAPSPPAQPAAARPNGAPPRYSEPRPPRMAPRPRPAPVRNDGIYDLTESDLIDGPVPSYPAQPVASPTAQWTEADWPSDGRDVRKHLIVGGAVLVGVIVAGVLFAVVRNATRQAPTKREIAAADAEKLPDEAAPPPPAQPPAPEIARASPAPAPATSQPKIRPRSATAASWVSYIQAEIRYLNALADAFATIRDEPSSKQALPRISDARKRFESEGHKPATQALTRSEKTDLWSEQGPALQRAARRVLDELRRIQSLPGHSPSVESSLAAFTRFWNDAEQLLNPKPPPRELAQNESQDEPETSPSGNAEPPAVSEARPAQRSRPRPPTGTQLAGPYDREMQERRARLQRDLREIDVAIQVLSGPNPARFRPAITVLKDKGPVASRRARAAKALERAIKGLWNPRDGFLMADLSVALAKWSGKEDVPTLIRLLDRERWMGRAELVRALGSYKDPRAIDALLDYLGKEGAVFDVLRKDGPSIERGALAQLKKRDPAVRREVCRLLKEIGTPACLDELESVAREDPDEGVHREAESAVRTIREKQLREERDAIEVDRALGILNSADTARYRQAVNTIKSKEPNARRAQVAAGIEKAIKAIWNPQDGFLMADLSVALAKWGGPENVPTLLRLLDRDRWMGRREIILGLAKLKDPRAVAALAPFLGKDGAVIEALQSIGAAAEPGLLPYLKSPEVAVRRDACRALEQAGTSASLDELEDLMHTDPDDSVQRQAANTLKLIDERMFKEQ